MTKEQFLFQLEQLLLDLPQEERVPARFSCALQL